MGLNYQRDMWIDSSALDVEWLDQPDLMIKYSEAHANADREVDRLDEKLGVQEAEIDSAIREDPEKFGLEKITDKSVALKVSMDKKVRKIKKELMDAKYEARMYKGAVRAVEHRKDALQELVKLHGQNYFAGPKIPRDLSHEVKQKQKKEKSNEAISIGKRRRTK